MAQPFYAIQYLGTVVVTKNTPYTTATILASYPGATIAKLKTLKHNDYVGISINSTPMVQYQDGEEQFIATGFTFEFEKDCIMKIGIYKVVV